MRFKFYLLNEGGNAIKLATRINHKNFDSTVQDFKEKFLPKINLSHIDMRILGSGGKKTSEDTYGDIDIALPISLILKRNNLSTYLDVKNFIIEKAKKFSNEVRSLSAGTIVSLAWPIYNSDKKQENSYAQIDLMLTDDLDWADFTYHSPTYYESKWKGIYRNFLLFGVAREISYKPLQQKKIGSEIIDTEWEKFIIDMNDGLMLSKQTRLGKKGDLIKAHKTFEKTFITKDPQKTVDILFGEDFKPSDLISFESIMKVLNSPKFKYKDKLKKIFSFTAKSLHDNGYPLPDELKKHL